MACVIGKVCPGVKNRTGALIAGLSALFLAACLIISAILSMIYTYRETTDSTGDTPTTPVHKEMIQCYVGAGFAIWGVWVMLTIVMIFGIFVENKRALGFWLAYAVIIPLYLVGGIIFLFSAIPTVGGWVISYLVVQVVNLLGMVWICLAVWVFFGEIRQRDKNPELRENELMFAQPFLGVMPPAGSYNPGYGAPSGGSMSSIPRSQKSRHTYAPTEAGESVRAASTGARQSRFDQYKAQHADPVKSERSRSRSAEKEGGYYRYQYTTDQKGNGSVHGSQGSLGGRPAQPPQYQPAKHEPPQYQPARYQRPSQSSQRQLQSSQDNLDGRQPYQPQAQHHASQGSLGRQAYVPRHHASQGSLGGRPQYQLQAQDNQHKDSEV